MRGRPNCQHLDNYRRCRIHPATSWWDRLFRLRPRCVLDGVMPPIDGGWTCMDQKPYPRPAPPQGQSAFFKPRAPGIVTPT
jgi:hypothetical protein